MRRFWRLSKLKTICSFSNSNSSLLTIPLSSRWTTWIQLAIWWHSINTSKSIGNSPLLSCKPHPRCTLSSSSSLSSCSRTRTFNSHSSSNYNRSYRHSYSHSLNHSNSISKPNRNSWVPISIGYNTPNTILQVRKSKTLLNSMKKQKNLIKNLYWTIPGLCRHKSTSNKTTSWLLIRIGWAASCMLSL